VKAVIDTNVLVSGLLKQGTPPAEVVDDVLAGELVPLYDSRMLNEYRGVLARPKFRRVSPENVRVLLELIVAGGREVPNAHFAGQLPDPGDQPFADVAFTGDADLLITGNKRDFRVGRAIRVVTPREWLGIKEHVRLLRELGEDERGALEPNEPFPVAVVCRRCGRARVDEMLGVTPLAQPQREPYRCVEPDPDQPDGTCGGEVWSYDDNDIGRRTAATLGLPTSTPR